MTSRERVLNALSFQPTDRLPKDLGAMRATGISAFAYPRLVEALGLPSRRPKIHDSNQMLALPDLDVLDALGCDVVTIDEGVSNAFEEAEKWQPYDFNGRLPALVRCAAVYSLQSNGTILNTECRTRMLPSSFVFDEEHGGQPLDFGTELPKYDLKQYRKQLQSQEISDKEIKETRELCRRVRESTDRAVFYNGPTFARISIHGHGGMAVFPVLCLLEPDYVSELHHILTEHTLTNLRRLLPEIQPYVDIIMTACDDWGTQNTLIASPELFRRLFLPYRIQLNEESHRLAPGVKTFLHSCGAIYELIDMIVESSQDILNPVQWPAGGHSYRAWKDSSRGRIALWGGGLKRSLPCTGQQNDCPDGSLKMKYLSTSRPVYLLKTVTAPIMQKLIAKSISKS